MRHICKVKIDSINKAVRSKSKLLLLTNTDQVLNWFIGLVKEAYSFFKFDMIDFYPSIGKELVTKTQKFSESYTNITAGYLSLFKNACKYIIYSRGNLWRKKRSENNNSLFDVAQGSKLGRDL